MLLQLVLSEATLTIMGRYERDTSSSCRGEGAWTFKRGTLCKIEKICILEGKIHDQELNGFMVPEAAVFQGTEVFQVFLRAAGSGSGVLHGRD